MSVYSKRIKDTRILVFSVKAPTEEQAKQALNFLEDSYVLEDLKYNWDEINASGILNEFQAILIESPEEEDSSQTSEYLGVTFEE